MEHAADTGTRRWATTTGAGARVGIVDTGVDLGHPDLAGRIAAAVTCSDNTGDPSHCTNGGQDIEGHGTHVSGIIAADKDNNVGVVGVAVGEALCGQRLPQRPQRLQLPTVRQHQRHRRRDPLVDERAHVQVINLSLGDSGNGLLGTGLFRGPSNLRGPGGGGVAGRRHPRDRRR